MSEVKDENNFLIEITPEVMTKLNDAYFNSDEEPVTVLHYSPYWRTSR